MADADSEAASSLLSAALVSRTASANSLYAAGTRWTGSQSDHSGIPSLVVRFLRIGSAGSESSVASITE
jgi:hypothetical protein